MQNEPVLSGYGRQQTAQHDAAVSILHAADAGQRPNAMIQEMVSSGRISQDQLNQVQNQAQQMQGMFEGMRGMFGK